MSDQGHAEHFSVERVINAVNDLHHLRHSPEMAAHASDLVKAGAKLSEVAIAALARKYKGAADAAAS